MARKVARTIFRTDARRAQIVAIARVLEPEVGFEPTTCCLQVTPEWL